MHELKANEKFILDTIATIENKKIRGRDGTPIKYLKKTDKVEAVKNFYGLTHGKGKSKRNKKKR